MDSIITLHEVDSKIFTNNGLGTLPDAITCNISEERNGEYELEMTYPITGKRYYDILLDRIIASKSNPHSNKRQGFRIYKVTKPIDGVVTVYAEHISYDLSGYPINPKLFSATDAKTAMSELKSSSVLTCPFTFSTDKTTKAKMNPTTPSSIRSLLGGVEGSILDIYGGEYEFDNFEVKLLNKRGADRGFSIRYGKNLTDINQEEECSNVYTGIYPFWYSDEDGLVQLDEKYILAEGTFKKQKILMLDLSMDFTEKPTQENIRTVAKAYMTANDIGKPKVSLAVSFIALDQSSEYKDYAILQEVNLCDTVSVEFPELGVKSSSKCIRTVYNALTDKYDLIELGDARSNLSTGINNVVRKAEEDTKKETERATEKEKNIQVNVDKNAEDIKVEVSRATSEEESIKSSVQINSENIHAEVERATQEEGKLKSSIDMTAESITAEVSRATKAEGELKSSLTMTATDITLEVSRAKKAEEELKSSIKLTAESITAEVSRATKAEGELKSSLKLTADSITAEVSRAKKAEETLKSSITMTDSSITAEVTRAKKAEESLKSSITITEINIDLEVTRAKNAEGELRSSIEVAADSITSKVSKNEISSYIKQYYNQVLFGFNENSKVIQLSTSGITLYNGSVSNTNKTVNFNGTGLHFYNTGSFTGSFNSAYWIGHPNIKGLSMSLEYIGTTGSYLSWSYKKSSSDEAYTSFLTFTTKKDIMGSVEGPSLNVGTVMDFHGNKLINADIRAASANGYSVVDNKSVNIITSIKRTSDGGITWTESSFNVRSGLVTNVPSDSTNI